MSAGLSISAYSVDHPNGRFWRGVVTCPHGLTWYVPNRAWSQFRTEQDTLRAADVYRAKFATWDSAEVCQAYHDRANTPSATAAHQEVQR